jgi:Concanavalin A-like lectin/glucanases superfamily
MAINYNPRIVTDGLIFALDAGNTKSYPGSGSTWTDRSLSRNNATLLNTPSFNSSNGGHLSFASASSQYATATNPGNLSTWTAEAMVRFTSSYSTKVAMVIGNQYNGASSLNFTIGTNNAPINFNIAVGFFDGAWRSTTGINYALNTWVHITGTYDGSVIRQYTNGVQVDSLNYVGTPTSGGEIRINRRWDDVVSSGNLFDSNIAAVRVYNRALTAAEVSQNFNALRGRFGI